MAQVGAAAELFARVGARICTLRKQRQLTQESLAEAAELSPAYLARIEAGAREPTLRTLLSVAEALDVPVTLLFEEERAGVPPELRAALDGLDPRDVDLLAALARRLRTTGAATRSRPAPSASRRRR